MNHSYIQDPNQHRQVNMISISLSFVTVNKPNWCRSKHLFHVRNRAWLSKKHSDEWPWGDIPAIINRQSVMESAYSALIWASSLLAVHWSQEREDKGSFQWIKQSLFHREKWGEKQPRLGLEITFAF